MRAEFQLRPGLALLVLLLCAFADGRCPAQVTLLLQSGYVSDLDTVGNVDFVLQFNRAPNFFDTDTYGRQADSFQFYIGTTTNVPIFYPPRPYASLVRGGEIHFGGGLVIRNDGPPDETDPHSDGWGSVRGAVAFNLTGNTLAFSIPAGVLNIQGPFGYSVLLTCYGAATRDPYTGESGFPIPVPEPAITTLLLAAFLTRLALPK